VKSIQRSGLDSSRRILFIVHGYLEHGNAQAGKAHPLANWKIFKELAVFQPMGTFTLETMRILRPFLIRSPTRSGELGAHNRDFVS
jgi:hypothetical protein